MEVWAYGIACVVLMAIVSYNFLAANVDDWPMPSEEDHDSGL